MSVALIYTFLFGIEAFMAQLEQSFYILTMQGIYNNIYDNVHNIIGWDPNEGKKNVERGTEVTVDANDIDTGWERILEEKVKMSQVSYSAIPIYL